MPAFQPKFQGDEDPRIGQIDELMQAVLLDLRIMQRASTADKPRYRAKIRETLVTVAERTMGLADTFTQ